MSDVVMSWSKCSIKIGKTGAGDTMAADLESIGLIKDKTAVLETAPGDTLEAKTTGGERFAYEGLEGTFTLSASVYEPDFKFLANMLGSDVDEDGDEITINTLIVPDNYSVELTPKNVGATGIRAPKTRVILEDTQDEENGRVLNLKFEILKTTHKDEKKRYFYKRFKKKA